MLFLLIALLISCGYSDSVKVEVSSPVLPVLTGKAHNPVQKIHLIRENPEDYMLEKVILSLKGTTDTSDIEKVSLFMAGNNEKFETNNPVGEAQPATKKITFTDQFPVTEDTLTLWVTVTLKENIDLTHRVKVECAGIHTDKGKINIPAYDTESLRVGVAVRQHKQDGVHTSRIPGLETSKEGTLMAIYDARYDSGRDLQGHMDIAMNRSFDGGRTWEPLQVVLDMNEWGSPKNTME